MTVETFLCTYTSGQVPNAATTFIDKASGLVYTSGGGKLCGVSYFGTGTGNNVRLLPTHEF